jgi:hypothetical protein
VGSGVTLNSYPECTHLYAFVGIRVWTLKESKIATRQQLRYHHIWMCTVSDGVSINNLVFDRSDIFVLYSKWPTMRWVKAFEGSESLFICSIEVDSSCDRIHSMDDFERCLDPVRVSKVRSQS